MPVRIFAVYRNISAGADLYPARRGCGAADGSRPNGCRTTTRPNANGGGAAASAIANGRRAADATDGIRPAFATANNNRARTIDNKRFNRQHSPNYQGDYAAGNRLSAAQILLLPPPQLQTRAPETQSGTLRPQAVANAAAAATAKKIAADF